VDYDQVVGLMSCRSDDVVQNGGVHGLSESGFFLGLSCHEAGYASGSVYLQAILVEGVWNLGEFFTVLVFWCFASSDIFVYL